MSGSFKNNKVNLSGTTNNNNSGKQSTQINAKPLKTIPIKESGDCAVEFFSAHDQKK